MYKAGAILVALTIACLCGYGQKSISISGVVRNTNGDDLAKATVILLSPIDTMKCLTGENGHFVFHTSQGGKFILTVTMEGYKAYRNGFSVDQDKASLVLSPIVLGLQYEELVPVMVMAIKPLTIKGDTVEYNAGAYKIREGAELEDLLKRLPGMQSDTGGNILIQGKGIGRVMINGQDFTGGDVMTALRDLPADIIDKIQVIDDYGDKARLTGIKSGESIKAVNIILKKDKRDGGIGKAEAGAGDKGKYDGELFSDAFKDDRQLTLNGKYRNISPEGNDVEKLIFLGYSNKWSSKWSGGGGLSIGGQNRSSETGLIQDNFFPGSQLHLQQTTQSSSSMQNYGIPLSFKFTPDPNTFFRFYTSFGINKNQQNNSNTFSTLEQDSGFTKNTNGNSTNRIQSNSLSSISDIYFEKVNPGSKRRFSVDIGYQYVYKRQNGDNLTHTMISSDSLNAYSQQNLLSVIRNHSRDLTTKLNYYLPAGKSAFLELGYIGDYSTTENDLLTQTPDSTPNSLLTIDSLSNDYIFTKTIQRFHVGYLVHSQKLNLSLGLDAQPGMLNGQTPGKSGGPHYKYFALLPQAEVSYDFTPFRKLHFEYTGSSQPPTLQQLQPVTNLSNPQYPVEGNPNLKPAYSQTAKLNYEQSSLKPDHYQAFSIGLNYSTTQDMVITALVHPLDTSSIVQRTSYLNINGVYSFGADYKVSLPAMIHRGLRISIDGNMSTNHSSSMVNDILYSTSSLNWGQGLEINVLIPDIIETQLAGFYAHTFTQYSSGTPPSSFSSFNWVFTSRNYIFQKWALNYGIRQIFSSIANGGLQSSPAQFNASFERNLFPKNQLNIKLSAYDLLNGSSGQAESISPTSITQTDRYLIGRYFLVSLTFKFEKFENK